MSYAIAGVGGSESGDSEVRVDLFDTHSSSWLTVLANPAQEIWGGFKLQNLPSLKWPWKITGIFCV